MFLIMLLTVVVPLRKAKLRDFTRLSTDAKNQRVNTKCSTAGIDFLARFDNF